jgi:hypothetical protein
MSRATVVLTSAISALVVLAVSLELLFRVLPVSTATLTGYYVDPSLLTYPPGHRWTTSSGWDLRNAHRLQANNVGFAADRDFAPDPNAVALIGDSFVEASMLDAPDRPAAQLESALDRQRPVYAMGGPGSSLLDYAERMRWAHQRFAVRDVVVMMEVGDVRQSLCGSGHVHAACLDAKTLAPRIETLPAPGAFKQLLRHSALAQYIFSQLKLNASSLWLSVVRQSRPGQVVSAAGAQGATTRTADFRVVDAVAGRFFERIKELRLNRLVIVLDSDRADLWARQVTVDPERQRFIELARAEGAAVIDTQPVYAAHAASSRLRLEVGPYDAHLNRLGVRLTMSEAARALTAIH